MIVVQFVAEHTGNSNNSKQIENDEYDIESSDRAYRDVEKEPNMALKHEQQVRMNEDVENVKVEQDELGTDMVNYCACTCMI